MMIPKYGKLVAISLLWVASAQIHAADNTQSLIEGPIEEFADQNILKSELPGIVVDGDKQLVGQDAAKGAESSAVVSKTKEQPAASKVGWLCWATGITYFEPKPAVNESKAEAEFDAFCEKDKQQAADDVKNTGDSAKENPSEGNPSEAQQA
jgi:hypothetical protein